jgi:hypothetical protein
MEDKARLQQAFEFIKSKKLAVISSVNSRGKPESAVVGFSETNDYEIIFGTFASSRKYQNLKHNGNVSLVIGWDEGRTVQYEGLAEEITDPKTIGELKLVHTAKIPSAIKYIGMDEERFFIVRPKWLRYSNLSLDPWEIFEIRF